MEEDRRKVGVFIVFDAYKNVTEITMGQFIELLQREHSVDEKIHLSEVAWNIK